MVDFANIAAAQAAGYTEIAAHKSDGSYLVTLEKQMTGAAGASGQMMRGYGAGPDQATAEAQALADINGQRRVRYAGTSSIPVAGSFISHGSDVWNPPAPPGGAPLTPDVS
jgi:hypothetical protein